MMVRTSANSVYRSLTIIAVVAALLIGSTSAAWSQETTDEGARERSARLSLNLTSVTLGSVLKVMTQKTGINFLIGSDLVGKTINVYLEDVLVEDALAAIMKANGLWYTRQKGTNIYVIMESPDGPPVATVTDVFHTDYADAGLLNGAAAQLLPLVQWPDLDSHLNLIDDPFVAPPLEADRLLPSEGAGLGILPSSTGRLAEAILTATGRC